MPRRHLHDGIAAVGVAVELVPENEVPRVVPADRGDGRRVVTLHDLFEKRLVVDELTGIRKVGEVAPVFGG